MKSLSKNNILFKETMAMSLSRTETLFLNLVREDFTDKGKILAI